MSIPQEPPYPPSPTSKAIGNAVEAAACEYLQEKGLRLIEQNFNCRLGEIDLIMQDKATLVFIEVRYRHSQRYGSPAASITPFKQRKIIKTALYYLQRNRKRLLQQAIRFDVVTLDKLKTNRQKNGEFSWIQNAFGVNY